AGLAYTGVADSVRCYYCSIGLKDWPKDACPWEQHILASPDCGHVAQCKGKAYVRKILGENDQDSDVEVDDSKEFVDTVEEAIKRNEAAVTAAKQYYTNEQIINKAIKSLIKGERPKTFNSVELIAAIEEVEKEQLGNNSQAKSEDVETDGDTSESDEEDEEELNRQLKEPITCKICFNAIACIITLPCGHMVSCPQCIPALTKCAVCRADIKGTVRALMALLFMTLMSRLALIQESLALCRLRLRTDNVKVWQRDNVTVWKRDNVTVWKRDVTVWQRDSVEVGQRDSVEAGRDSVDAGQRDSVEAGQRDSVAAGQRDSVEVGQRDSVEAGRDSVAANLGSLLGDCLKFALHREVQEDSVTNSLFISSVIPVPIATNMMTCKHQKGWEEGSSMESTSQEIERSNTRIILEEEHDKVSPSMNNNKRRSSTQRLNEKQRSKCISLGITFFKPKHRQYCTLDSRLKSYENENWIKDKTPGVKELAEAGLAYTGVADSVSCYYCNIGLQNWPKDACPWEQHVVASPDCAHVAQCKGKAYVRKILGENDQDSDFEVDDSKDFVDTVEEAIKRNGAAVTAAKKYHTNEQIINKAVKSLINSSALKPFNAVELIAAIEEVEKESKKRKQSEQLANNSQAKSEDVETDGDTSESDEEDEELNRRLKKSLTCKICFNAVISIITLPCGHMISCSQCIPPLTRCAVCRADIKGTVRALMAV
ncbi:uncharacterized protein LOC132738945, partial [Ruditapes philippinarum]|uniref:uncharacterized protein LOC132738945 n=1 Tax=Ruditapes philippinarum TaxID=129788 RepID=UPI00295BBAFF